MKRPGLERGSHWQHQLTLARISLVWRTCWRNTKWVCLLFFMCSCVCGCLLWCEHVSVLFVNRVSRNTAILHLSLLRYTLYHDVWLESCVWGHQDILLLRPWWYHSVSGLQYSVWTRDKGMVTLYARFVILRSESCQRPGLHLFTCNCVRGQTIFALKWTESFCMRSKKEKNGRIWTCQARLGKLHL